MSKKVVYIGVALGLCLVLLLTFFLIQSSKGMSREELTEAWMEQGLTRSQALKRAERGEQPVELEVSSEEPPLTLQGPSSSNAIPEAVIGDKINEIFLGKKKDVQTLCTDDNCLSALESFQRKSIFGFVSEIFYEGEESIFTVSLLCLEKNGYLQAEEPFFSELILIDGQWEEKRFFISLEQFVKESGAFTKVGKESLASLRQQLASPCQGKA